MKTTQRITVITAIVTGVLAGLYYAGPAFRTEIDAKVRCWMGWTDKARQADPVGFVEHVEGRLQEDLGKLESTRHALISEAGTLAENMRQQQALLEHAERLAAEFRTAYQAAQQNGGFPVTLHNAVYTEEQIVSQVSLLLAEANGYRESLAKVGEIRRTAEEKLEALTLRIDSTRAQLAAVGTKRELLRARVLTTEGEQLIAHVDRLLETNEQLVHSNPVRNVAELLAADEKQQGGRPNAEAARAYLVAQPEIEAPSVVDKQPVKVREEPKLEVTTTEPVSTSQSDDAEPATRPVRIITTYPVIVEPVADNDAPVAPATSKVKPHKNRRPANRSIFEQS